MQFTNWNEFWTSVVTAAVPFLFAAIVFVLHQLWSYLGEKTATIKNQGLRDALLHAEGEAEHVTSTVVEALNQTVVGDLKAQNSGKLSVSDAEKVKNDAIATIKSTLSSEAVQLLTEHRGDLIAYLGTLLEATVGRLKQ